MEQAKSNMGRLKVQCFRGNDYIPIDGAKITVKGSAGSENLKNIELVTNAVGLTNEIELEAPPIEYSLDKNSNKIPYSLYDITVERNGFKPIIIRGMSSISYTSCLSNM